MKLSIDFLCRNFSLDKRLLNIIEHISIQNRYISSYKTFIEQKFKFSVSNKTCLKISSHPYMCFACLRFKSRFLNINHNAWKNCHLWIKNYCTIEIWGMNNFFDVWSNIFLAHWRCLYKGRCACTDTHCWFHFLSVCDCRGKYIARWCAVRCWCSCRLGKLSLRSARWYRTGRWCSWFHVRRHMWCHSWCSNRWNSGGSCWCVRGIGMGRDDGYPRIKTLHAYREVLCKM